MICRNCRREIKDGIKFCPYCGGKVEYVAAPVVPEKTSVVPETGGAGKPKGKKSFAIGFLCGVLVLAILVGGAFAVWKFFLSDAAEAVTDDEPVAAEPAREENTDQVEGSGYDSPQRAVGAYLEALKTGDVNEMLATFAVETYVDRYDMAASIDQSRALSFSSAKQQFQPVDSYTRELNVIHRISKISESFVWQYEVLSGNDVDELLQIITISGSSPYADGAEVVADLVNPDWMKNLDKIIINEIHELSDFVADFDDINYNDGFTDSVEAWGDVYGCDEIRCMVAVFEYDGVDYYFTADVARYADAWYMLDANGMGGALLGMTVNCGGMTPTEEFW